MIDPCAVIRDELRRLQTRLDDGPEVTRDTYLHDICRDGLDVMCVICALDEAFGIELPDAAADAETVADLIAIVDRLAQVPA